MDDPVETFIDEWNINQIIGENICHQETEDIFFDLAQRDRQGCNDLYLLRDWCS